MPLALDTWRAPDTCSPREDAPGTSHTPNQLLYPVVSAEAAFATRSCDTFSEPSPEAGAPFLPRLEVFRRSLPPDGSEKQVKAFMRMR